MKKLMIAAAVAIGASAAFSEVYDVKYTLKAAVDVASKSGEVTTSIKSITVQGLWNGEVDPAKADYRFWLVNGKDYTAIKDATLDYVASSAFLKKDVLDESQGTDELELIWKDEAGNTCAIVAAGATKNKKVGKGDEAYYILNTMSGNAAGQISKAPAYGTWSVKINSTATKSGMDAATPKQFKEGESAKGAVVVDFGTSQKGALDAWKAVAPYATDTAKGLVDTLAELAATKADLDQAWADLKELGGLYDESQANLAAANADIAAKTAKIAELEAEIAAKQAEIAALEAQVAALKDEVAKKVEELKAAEDAYAALQAEKDALQAKYDALEAAAGKEKAELAEKIAALEAQIAEMKQFIEDQQKEIAELNDTIAAMNKEMEEFKKAMDELIAAKDGEIAALNDQVKHLEGLLSTTQEDLENLIKNIQNLDVKDEVTTLISTYLSNQYGLLMGYTNDMTKASADLRDEDYLEKTEKARIEWEAALKAALAARDEVGRQQNEVNDAQELLDVIADAITNSIPTVAALEAQLKTDAEKVKTCEDLIAALEKDPWKGTVDYYLQGLMTASNALETAEVALAEANFKMQDYIKQNGQPNGEPLTLEQWCAEHNKDVTDYNVVYVEYPAYVKGYGEKVDELKGDIDDCTANVEKATKDVEKAEENYARSQTNPKDTDYWKNAKFSAEKKLEAAQAIQKKHQEQLDFAKKASWADWEAQKKVVEDEQKKLDELKASADQLKEICVKLYGALKQVLTYGNDPKNFAITGKVVPIAKYNIVNTEDLDEMKASYEKNPDWDQAKAEAKARFDGWIKNATDRMASIEYICDKAKLTLTKELPPKNQEQQAVVDPIP